MARAGIKAGSLRGAMLLELLLSIPPRDRDVWLDEVLEIEDPPPDMAHLPRGAVPYLPCGVDEILTLVRAVPLRPDDELVDLGSGLGRVVILAHLLSGARAHGIELQEALVRSAQRRAARLQLGAVSFARGNAAETELDGSIFFLYSPFNGQMLDDAVQRMEQVARRRPIVVCAVGLDLHHLPWLRPRELANPALSLYDSIISGVLERPR